MIIDEGVNPEPLVRETRGPRPLAAPLAECAECARLVEQGRAAVLTGDRSRLSDVWVLKERHDAAEHAEDGQA
jgi:hypothetical protein